MKVDVGDVVLIEFMDYQRVKTTGLFAVFYHESYDIPTSSSFRCIKISTESRSYQVPLQARFHAFLDHDSYLNCTSQFTFLESQVIKIIGRLSPYILDRIVYQLNHLNASTVRQLRTKIGRRSGLQ